MPDRLVSSGCCPEGLQHDMVGAGATLVAHPGVDKVAFTGSTAAGRKVALACAERFSG